MHNRFCECHVSDNGCVHRSHLDCAHNFQPYHYVSSARSCIHMTFKEHARNCFCSKDDTSNLKTGSRQWPPEPLRFCQKQPGAANSSQVPPGTATTRRVTPGAARDRQGRPAVKKIVKKCERDNVNKMENHVKNNAKDIMTKPKM